MTPIFVTSVCLSSILDRAPFHFVSHAFLSANDSGLLSYALGIVLHPDDYPPPDEGEVHSLPTVVHIITSKVSCLIPMSM